MVLAAAPERVTPALPAVPGPPVAAAAAVVVVVEVLPEAQPLLRPRSHRVLRQRRSARPTWCPPASSREEGARCHGRGRVGEAAAVVAPHPVQQRAETPVRGQRGTRQQPPQKPSKRRKWVKKPSKIWQLE